MPALPGFSLLLLPENSRRKAAGSASLRPFPPQSANKEEMYPCPTFTGDLFLQE